MGANLCRSACPGRRRGGPGLGRRRRFHDRPCPPARRRSPSKGAPAGEPHDHALGRSRGGLTTKIHLASDGRCRPLAFILTPGQAGDAPAFTQVMATIRVTRPKGRPRTRPVVVPADKAYSSRAIREHLRRRRIRAVIPQPADQITNRRRLGSKGGRPPGFDREAYKRPPPDVRCRGSAVQPQVRAIGTWPGPDPGGRGSGPGKENGSVFDRSSGGRCP
ncbi:hypothetical protein CG724_17250 [Streptomyces sp. CB02120-2]|nr:hypothetical protein CG724_17250 [Streptomyces sp. CB02120-2]